MIANRSLTVQYRFFFFSICLGIVAMFYVENKASGAELCHCQDFDTVQTSSPL